MKAGLWRGFGLWTAQWKKQAYLCMFLKKVLQLDVNIFNKL